MNWKKLLIGTWSWKRPFFSLLAIYLMLAVVVVFFADRLIFIPPPSSYGPEATGLLRLRTSAGEEIAAIHLPAKEGMPTLLYSHGNAEDLGHSIELYQAWNDMGLGVLVYDYPGYGLSTGRATERSCERAIQAAWDHLMDSGVSACSVVVVSRSVGGGPGVWLASRCKPAGLVLIAPFTSTFAVAFPVPLFPCDRFPNLKRIRHIDVPLKVFHGEQDEVIASSHGRKLVEASPAEDKSFALIENAEHNDLFEVAGDQIIRETAEFAIRVTR